MAVFYFKYADKKEREMIEQEFRLVFRGSEIMVKSTSHGMDIKTS